MKVWHLLVFIDVRVRGSVVEEPSHWMVQCRAALLSVVSFLLEVRAYTDLEVDAVKSNKRTASDLWGKTGVRKVHRAVLPRMQLLRRLLDTGGSSEAVTHALTAGVKGVASQQRAVRNAVYTDCARTLFEGCARLSVGWDGSSHAGRDVQMGIAYNVDEPATAYLKPAATLLVCKITTDQAHLQRATGDN